MHRASRAALAAVLLAQALAPCTAVLAGEETYYRRGYGVKDSNVFAPNYDKRLKNWLEQINLGRTRGFLTEAQAQEFTKKHAELSQIFVDVDKAGYPKDQLDAMEQKFNAFNVELTDAMSKPASSAAPVPTDTVPAPAPNVVPQPTAIPAPAAAQEPLRFRENQKWQSETPKTFAGKPAAAPRPSTSAPSRTDRRPKEGTA
jgi:hypothetical protein